MGCYVIRNDLKTFSQYDHLKDKHCIVFHVRFLYQKIVSLSKDYLVICFLTLSLAIPSFIEIEKIVGKGDML